MFQKSIKLKLIIAHPEVVQKKKQINKQLVVFFFSPLGKHPLPLQDSSGEETEEVSLVNPEKNLTKQSKERVCAP